MTPQQIVGLGVRLFAIWIALRGGSWLAQGLTGINDAVSGPIARDLIFWGAAYLVGGLLFWNFPMWVAHKLIPKTAHENVLNVPLFDAARVGSALIGLWLVTTTFQNVIWFIITALVAGGSDSFFAATSKDNKISFALDIFQVGLGLFLMFRSQWFAKIVLKSEPAN